MKRVLIQLLDAGQSVWIDNMSRRVISSGELGSLVDRGVRGATSNPTIFGNAVGDTDDYDEQLRSLATRQNDPQALFLELAIRDIRDALDLFRPVYDASGGSDGFVNLEVSPFLAHNTEATIASARELWHRIDRPNAMIKIPGRGKGSRPSKNARR